jgi:hypothetical protein
MRRLLALLLLILSGPGLLRARADDIDFSRDVRPLLSDNCFFCHGPDEKKRQADLRLDTRAGALAVLTPGKSADSELIRRITSGDPEEVMPPTKSNRKFSGAQISLITRWVDAGAPWGEHWAFRKLQKPPVPDATAPNVKPLGSGTSGNAVDAFIQARLVKEGLMPAPEAPRETLIRRLSLDLTGLPPTPAEVDAFVADADPAAYEKVVDRLLASPAYGERMAWDWLDAARYADSNGYQGDGDRTMWPWRDWVVDALNRNLPYDQFTVWQLAGDLLPGATFEQQLATGFCRNHMINGEGGRIADENRVDYVMDMSETMATVWLGLTTNCCRCHDHKFDPLTQRDYYKLFAFFDQTPVTGGGGNPQTPPVLELPTDAQQQEIAQLGEKVAAVKTQIDARASELAAGQASWEAQLAAAGGTQWTVLKPASAKSLNRQSLAIKPDNSVLAGGPNPANDTYTVTAPIDLENLCGIRLEALRDPSMTGNGLARSDSGNFVLTEFEVSLARPGEPEARPLKFAGAAASFEQGSFPVTAAFDGNPATGWAVWEGRIVDRDHEAVFKLAEPVAAGPGTFLTLTLRHDSRHASHNLGRFRLSVTSNPDPKLGGHAEPLAAALRAAAAERSKEQAELVAKAYHETDEAYRKLSAERQRYDQQLTDVRKAVAKVMVMADMPKPRKTFMLDRGLYNKPGEEVSAGVPASLPPMDAAAPLNRLGLAQWLVSADQPLTARVTVNRFWQQLFGVGLVKTTEDFGVQGEMPKHLDLLDWLAAEFRDGGWNVKGLIRRIVTSHAYRQSSKVSPVLAENDPDNRLLARGPRVRLPSWMLRDQALAAGGLLVSRVGGPPVKGYQPPGVWEEATFGNKTYKQGHGDELYRRSLYTFWRRIIGPTMFFDNAARQTCTVKVFRTNTPLHALLTLNDVTYVEAGRALAERVLTEASPNELALNESELNDSASKDEAPAAVDAAARLDRAFRRVLARRALPEERTILLDGLKRSLDDFRAHPEAADKLLKVGESKRNERLDPIEHAGWTSLCIAILNLDEALTKE